jgi:hypothetical protein
MYSPFVTSNVEYERIAALSVFSIHGDNIWKPLVRHEYLTTFILSIPKGIVEHRTAVHPARAFMSKWHDCVGWICRCVGGQMSWWFIIGARSHGVPSLRRVMQ